MKEGVLKGVRAIEWAAFGAGPIVGTILGDMGAEVIKIEDRVHGDPMRGVGAMYGVKMMTPEGINVVFEFTNRNKKGIRVDLKKPEGKEIIYRLVQNSDVFFTNYQRGMAAKNGVDYETLSKHNPKLVYAMSTGLGAKGAGSEKRCFDPVSRARSGFMWATGESDMPPLHVSGAIMDTLTGTMSAFGIVSALYALRETGVGQEVNSSLLGTALWSQFLNAGTVLATGHEMRRYKRTDVTNPLATTYKCKDGQWICLAEPQSQRHWARFCHVMGLQDLENDPKFRGEFERRKNSSELITILEKAFAEKNRDEWGDLFDKEGNKFLAWERILTISEALVDPQVLANGYVTEFDHPVLGKFKEQPFPLDFSNADTGPRTPAPEFGQHTEEILLDIGYTWDDISRLSEKGVI